MKARGAKRVTQVGLTVYNEPGEWLESVDITTTMPLGYAKLLIADDKFCDALEADLKEFLASKWKMLEPLVKKEARGHAK